MLFPPKYKTYEEWYPLYDTRGEEKKLKHIILANPAGQVLAPRELINTSQQYKELRGVAWRDWLKSYMWFTLSKLASIAALFAFSIVDLKLALLLVFVVISMES